MLPSQAKEQGKHGVLEVVWCDGLSAVYPVVSPEPRVVLCVLSLAYCRV